MCLSGYWQWKLANEYERISAVIVKRLFALVDMPPEQTQLQRLGDEEPALIKTQDVMESK